LSAGVHVSNAARRAMAARSLHELREGIRRFVARRVRDAALTEDLVQEVFLRIHEHIGELRDAAAITSWAYRIANNVVIDHARKRRPLESLDEASELASLDDDNGNINEEVTEWLRPMITLLPPEYAEALALTELEGLPQRELGAIGSSRAPSPGPSTSRIRCAPGSCRRSCGCCTWRIPAVCSCTSRSR
jgi:RNA polymerase sigma factor (sigma-70 family)